MHVFVQLALSPPSPARLDTPGSKNMKRNQFKKANLPILNMTFIFTVHSWTGFECVEAIRREQEREIMFTDLMVAEPGGRRAEIRQGHTKRIGSLAVACRRMLHFVFLF